MFVLRQNDKRGSDIIEVSYNAIHMYTCCLWLNLRVSLVAISRGLILRSCMLIVVIDTAVMTWLQSTGPDIYGSDC